VSKILAGLKEALAFARGKCRHEWTYWLHDARYPMWSHTCTKCKVTVTVKQRPDDYTD
jgi:hypothetical protein